MTTLKIETGPCCVTHLCTLDEFTTGKMRAVLVGHYADRMNLDLHPTEVTAVEVRPIGGTSSRRRYELRSGNTIIASAVESASA